MVCAGGGGIPVVTSPAGIVHGVEAVIDKDLAAALLAHQLGADALLLLTDVDAVYGGWGTPHQKAIRETMPEQLRKLAFAPGSMKPKIEAACRFVNAGGKIAGIGRLEDAVAILEGVRGTIVRPGGVSLDFTPDHVASAPQAPARQAPPAAKSPAAARPAPQPQAPAWAPFELPNDAPPPKPHY